MLTDDELRAAIEAARVFPPGHGWSWFEDDVPDYEAVSRLVLRERFEGY